MLDNGTWSYFDCKVQAYKEASSAATFYEELTSTIDKSRGKLAAMQVRVHPATSQRCSLKVMSNSRAGVA
jgi:hypothetical protein